MSSMFGQIARSIYENSEEDYGMSPKAWAALRYFHEVATTENRTQQHLARYLGIHKATTSRIVALLEKKELLYKAVKPGENRKRDIFITEQGCLLLEKDPELLLANILSQLTPEDVNNFQKMLEAIQEKYLETRSD